MDTSTLQLLVLLAFGLLQLFFGYPLFRILVVLAGAAVGWTYGPAMLTGLTGRPVEPWMALSAALVAAVVLGLLAWLAFWAVVFLWGAGIGYSILDAASATLLLPLLGGLVIGVLAVVFQRILIVTLTALSGAWVTTISAAALVGMTAPRGPRFDTVEPLLLIVVLVLAVVGAIAQFRRAVPPSGL
ncbi:MAG: hypothetical protein WD314_12705 [Trueperaceae bacterium]